MLHHASNILIDDSHHLFCTTSSQHTTIHTKLIFVPADDVNIHASDSFFFSVPPLGFGKQMPKHVNGESGKTNKTEVTLPNGLLKWSKVCSQVMNNNIE